MCFSSAASFGASGVLLVMGTAAIVKSTNPRQLPFAVIPVIFAVQQFTEGFLWLFLKGDFQGFQNTFTHVYLFFAEVLWPIWIPIAFLLLEENNPKRIFQKILVGVGFVVGVYLAFCLLTYDVKAEISGRHITYVLDYPKPLHGLGGLFYGLATIFPAFLSGIKRMKLFGFLAVVSYLFSTFYFQHAVISVWCYFAAMISICVYFLLPKSAEVLKES